MTTENREQIEYVSFGVTRSGRPFAMIRDPEKGERPRLLPTAAPKDALEKLPEKLRGLYCQGYAAGFRMGRTLWLEKRNQHMAKLVREQGYGVSHLAEVHGLSPTWIREILRSQGLNAADIRYYQKYNEPHPVVTLKRRRGRPRRK